MAGAGPGSDAPARLRNFRGVHVVARSDSETSILRPLDSAFHPKRRSPPPVLFSPDSSYRQQCEGRVKPARKAFWRKDLASRFLVRESKSFSFGAPSRAPFLFFIQVPFAFKPWAAKLL